MSYKSTKILLLGKKTQEGKTLQEFMPEQFPAEVPSEYIFSIKVVTAEDKTIELSSDVKVLPSALTEDAT